MHFKTHTSPHAWWSARHSNSFSDENDSNLQPSPALFSTCYLRTLPCAALPALLTAQAAQLIVTAGPLEPWPPALSDLPRWRRAGAGNVQLQELHGLTTARKTWVDLMRTFVSASVRLHLNLMPFSSSIFCSRPPPAACTQMMGGKRKSRRGSEEKRIRSICLGRKAVSRKDTRFLRIRSVPTLPVTKRSKMSPKTSSAFPYPCHVRCPARWSLKRSLSAGKVRTWKKVWWRCRK